MPKYRFSHDHKIEESKLSNFRKVQKQGKLKINILNSFQEPFKTNQPLISNRLSSNTVREGYSATDLNHDKLRLRVGSNLFDGSERSALKVIPSIDEEEPSEINSYFE